LFGGNPEPVDLVRRDTDRRGDRLRSGVQTDGKTEVEPGQPCADDGHDQAQGQHDHREQDLLRAVLAQPAEELRADAVPTAKRKRRKKVD
jgi:hypothetical protein